MQHEIAVGYDGSAASRSAFLDTPPPPSATMALAFEQAAAAGAELTAKSLSTPSDAVDNVLARWQEKFPDVRLTHTVVDRLSIDYDVRLVVVASPELLDEALLGHPYAPVAVVR